MGTLLVTIVIPTYNDDPAHLAEAVRSAKAQTYPAVEVVVVDDGSDVPVEPMEGVRLVRQENQGLPRARNAGIAEALGDLVLPLDGDDWIEPQTVQALVDALTSAPDVVAAYPFVRRFGAAEGVQHAPPEVRLADLAARNRVVSASLFRRSDWERVGGYDDQHDAPEDWLLWVKMLADGGQMIQAPEAVLHYRLRTGSLNTRYHDPEAALRRIAQAVPDRLPELLVAVTKETQEHQAELAELRAFHNAWGPRVAPLLRARDAARRALRRGARATR